MPQVALGVRRVVQPPFGDRRPRHRGVEDVRPAQHRERREVAAERPADDADAVGVDAGGTPTSLFTDSTYLDQQFGDYKAAVDKAEQATQASQAAGDTANGYVVTTILLAVALFFAGVTSSFQYAPARVFLIILALGTIAIAASRLADLPVIW